MCSRHTSFTMLLAAPSVVLTDAGTHTSWQRWIPAYAESAPQNAPRMGIKCSGVLKRNTRGMTDEKQGLDSRLRGNDGEMRE